MSHQPVIGPTYSDLISHIHMSHQPMVGPTYSDLISHIHNMSHQPMIGPTYSNLISHIHNMSHQPVIGPTYSDLISRADSLVEQLYHLLFLSFQCSDSGSTVHVLSYQLLVLLLLGLQLLLWPTANGTEGHTMYTRWKANKPTSITHTHTHPY